MNFNKQFQFERSGLIEILMDKLSVFVQIEPDTLNFTQRNWDIGNQLWHFANNGDLAKVYYLLHDGNLTYDDLNDFLSELCEYEKLI